MMDVGGKATRGVFGLGAYRLLGQGATWGVSLVMARLLEPQDFGLMALAIVFINLSNFISEFGISSAIVQKQHLSEDQINAAFWLMILLNCIVCSLLILGAQFIGDFYSNPRLPSIVQVLAINLILGAVRMTPLWLLAKDLDFRCEAISEFWANILSCVVAVTMAWSGFGVWALVGGSLSQNIIAILLIYYFRPWYPRLIFSIRAIRELITFGLSVNAAKICTYLAENGDNLVIGKVLGDKSLGLYNMAFVLGTAPIRKFSALIHHVLFPTFSKLQQDKKLLVSYFLSATEYVAIITYPASVGLFLLSSRFVELVLGAKWIPMVPAFKLLCILTLIKGMTATFGPLLYAKGRHEIMLLFAVLSGIIMPGSFYFGTQWGITGVATMWVTVYPMICVVLLVYVLAELGVSLREYLATIIIPLVASVVMAGAVMLADGSVSASGIPQLLMLALVGGFSYIAVLLVIRKKKTLADIRYVLSVARPTKFSV